MGYPVTEFRQLDIYWTNLEPAQGAETKKLRPCIIVQSNLINKHSRTLIVAPLLPGHKSWPFVVNLTPSKKNGLDKSRHINLKQLRAVDISRISQKQGILEKRYVKPINYGLGIVFNLSD
jgi:mRNA interferase MazF